MIRGYLSSRMKQVQQLKKQVLSSLKHAPAERYRLRGQISKEKYPQYYLIDKEKEKLNKYRDHHKKTHEQGTFLRKNQIEIASSIAQRDYDQEILKVLEKEENLIETLLKNTEEKRLEKVYDKLPPARKLIVKPYILPEEEFIQQWYKKYEGEKNTYPIENGFLTDRGEMVRSKTEKMIADKLFHMNIPYQYEPRLRTRNNRVVHPDFVILNKRSRKTYYLEHFGMMDNPDYCKKALEKIDIYEANEIYPGKTLLILMESSRKPINISSIDNLIHNYLI